MNKAYAFFDVDGTLIKGKSMFDFHDFWYQNGAEASSRHEHEDISAILSSLAVSGASRALINRRYYEFFAGRSVSNVTACAKAWAEQALEKPDFLVHKVVQRLSALRQDGVEPVFVSGSFVELLSPIAKALDVKYVLATRLVNDGKKYNGRITMPQTIGTGKAQAMHAFLADQDADGRDCWAFGDDISDVPMLELVGHPTAVIGDQELAMIAAIRDWPTIKLTGPQEQACENHMQLVAQAA
ncbi:MAG: HAD-IB family hydrolase [Burkholderiales bacterium]|nr:HAD-IB family hydrolase [Burkholderiales bacterium]